MTSLVLELLSSDHLQAYFYKECCGKTVTLQDLQDVFCELTCVVVVRRSWVGWGEGYKHKYNRGLHIHSACRDRVHPFNLELESASQLFEQKIVWQPFEYMCVCVCACACVRTFSFMHQVGCSSSLTASGLRGSLKT